MNFYICRQKANFSTFNLPSAAMTNFHSKKQLFVYYAQMSLLRLWRWFLLTDDSKVSLTPCRFSVSLAPFVTLARDTFLPERLIVTHCGAADFLPAESTQKFIRGCAAQNLVSTESQHPSVSRSADSSPLKKRAAFAGTNCGAEKENSAAFQSRGLLPSRSRVTPSSRRKAHGDKLHCRRFSSCRIHTKIHSRRRGTKFSFYRISTPLSRLRRQLPS